MAFSILERTLSGIQGNLVGSILCLSTRSKYSSGTSRNCSFLTWTPYAVAVLARLVQ